MNEDSERELIRAVVSTPDSDEPRLAYANWLQSHGQEDRAELIRVQCQIENLRSREHHLLNAHHFEWGKSLSALGVDRWAFHRGFPEEIEITPGFFMTNHQSINEITPVRRLCLVGRTSDDTLKELVKLPVFSQTQSLEIGTSANVPLPKEFGVNALQALASSNHLRNLQRLTLHSHGIGVAGAKIIAESPHLGNLTHLTLDDPVFDKGGKTIEDLATAPNLAGLQEVRLGKQVTGNHILRKWREPRNTDQSQGRSS